MILGRRARRTGFTLIEMTVVMWALGVAIALGTALVLATKQSARLSEASSERLSLWAELARQFRDDVAQAEAAPDKVGDTTAGPARLILQMRGGTVVEYQRENDTLERIERAGGQKTTKRFPLGRASVKTEFVRPGEGAKVVTLRLTDDREKGAGRASEVAAALGGDWR